MQIITNAPVHSLGYSRVFFCSLFVVALLVGCGGDSSKDNDDEPEAFECENHADCASRQDGKTECDLVNHICVAPAVTPRCGDGKLGVGESCDGNDLNGKTCLTFDGYVDGTLACNASCEFDKSGCFECTDSDKSKCAAGQICLNHHCVDEGHEVSCGDSIVERDEECDGSNLNGKSCADIDSTFIGGRLQCAECVFDTSLCYECTDNPDSCGDGKVCKNGSCAAVSSEPEDNPTACADTKDNDGDGQTDCDDSDCAEFCKTPENTREACSDEIDNDGDGQTDCDDSDCAEFCKTPENTSEACSDEIDNDGDGKTDCVDSDCAEFCKTPENTREACSDEIDNDGDGKTDCDDSDCAEFCKTPENTSEACSDEIDNDGDGKTDCDDSDCAEFCKTPENTSEACSDETDNDGDGKTDCDDSDCAEFCKKCADNQTYIAKYDVCAHNIRSKDDLISLCDTWNTSGDKTYITEDGKPAAFILTRDITLDNLDWPGIGSSSKPFNGIFWGNNKGIYGRLTTDTGLFGYSKDAVFEDLLLNLTVSGDNLGFLGFSGDSITVNNITVIGNATNKSYQVSGLLYRSNGHSIFQNINITFEPMQVSSVHGIAREMENATIHNASITFKNIQPPDSSYGNTNIVGLFYKNKEDSVVNASHISIDITASGTSGIESDIYGLAVYAYKFVADVVDIKIQNAISNMRIYSLVDDGTNVNFKNTRISTSESRVLLAFKLTKSILTNITTNVGISRGLYDSVEETTFSNGTADGFNITSKDPSSITVANWAGSISTSGVSQYNVSSGLSNDEIVSFLNKNLADKKPLIEDGKYLPWILGADGKPTLNFDATDDQMYTIP